MRYTICPVHRVSPRETDSFVVDIDPPEASKPALGALLRSFGVLAPGQRIHSFRVKDDGSVVAFPVRSSVWHSVSLLHAKES